MKQKTLGIIFLVVLAAAVVSGIYYWQVAKQPIAPMPVHKVVTANWNIYTNQDYNFQLTFTDAWKGYEVWHQTKASDIPDQYQVLMPTCDPGFRASTPEGGSGGCTTAPILYLTIYPNNRWQALSPKDKSHYTLISEHNGKVFVYGAIQPIAGDLKYINFEVPKVISTFKLISSTTVQNTGVLTGHVTVGPICPVERAGVPCPVPPEAYTSRQVGVYTIATATTPEGMTNAQLVAKQYLDANGNYKFDLPAGKYDIKASGMQVDQLTADEGTVTIKAGATTTLDFNIDTGIR